jgi:hypothetical protein
MYKYKNPLPVDEWDERKPILTGSGKSIYKPALKVGFPHEEVKIKIPVPECVTAKDE